MRPTPIVLVLTSACMLTAMSGCFHDLRQLAPPPPAYACDSYGCDGYNAFGGYSECVNDGQYYSSRRQARQARREVRHAGIHPGGPTYNGLPVVAAYIVPMDMCGGCGSSCGDCHPCGDCGPCDGCEPCENCGPCGDGSMYGGIMDGAYQQCGPNGCGFDESEWQPYESGQSFQSDGMMPIPNESFSYPGSGDGGSISPIPVPPAEEGPWTPPSSDYPSTPRSLTEPEASLPSGNWLPARF